MVKIVVFSLLSIDRKQALLFMSFFFNEVIDGVVFGHVCNLLPKYPQNNC